MLQGVKQNCQPYWLQVGILIFFWRLYIKLIFSPPTNPTSPSTHVLTRTLSHSLTALFTFGKMMMICMCVYLKANLYCACVFSWVCWLVYVCEILFFYLTRCYHMLPLTRAFSMVVAIWTFSQFFLFNGVMMFIMTLDILLLLQMYKIVYNLIAISINIYVPSVSNQNQMMTMMFLEFSVSFFFFVFLFNLSKKYMCIFAVHEMCL